MKVVSFLIIRACEIEAAASQHGESNSLFFCPLKTSIK
jgi:hypothetical protein